MNTKPAAEISVKVGGHFIFEKYKGDADGRPIGECLQRLEFDNHITDTGLTSLYSSPTDGFGVNYLISACVVGTGNTAPSDTDTQLAAWLATKSNGQYDPTISYVPGPPTYWRAVATFQFATGVATGNIAEVGIYSYGRDKNALFSRALILDGSGNPTTITVLADEVLNVTYEYRVYLVTSDTVGTFVSDGVTYDTVLRVSDISNPPAVSKSIVNNNGVVIIAYDGALGTITAQPSGNRVTISSINGGWALSNFLMAGGQASVDATVTAGVNAANWANGVRALYFGTNFHKFQMSFNDPLTGKGIPKVSGEQMTIGVRFKWSRYAA